MFTEIFSWGDNAQGQLGLGDSSAGSEGGKKLRKTHKIPRYCSFNVIIKKLACGREHTVFITQNDLVYSMGCNSHGQLGVGELHTTLKRSPTLIESLLSQSERLSFADVKCGAQHTLLLGEVGGQRRLYSWGNNEHGQCGVGQASMAHPERSREARRPSTEVIIVTPRMVSWQSLKDQASMIECGSQHSALVD